jgi:ABC-type multidrug transport system ATPase subunit
LKERKLVEAIVRRGTVDARESAIFVHALQKIYLARGNVPAKVAVKDISLSIPQGEIFGLLGANGAGKTTLLKMVSGLEEPSSGLAMINGYDVVTQTTQAQRSMGLCPQFDTLLDRLSVRENLVFFGRIKGLEGDELTETVEAFMQALNIKRYENKLTQHLSGGNRRKVSLAVALIGAPPTVYLDEPSTGLDPVASRLMWRLLSKIAEAKTTAIVLTTHNMLECEAVCTRLCIMKMGEMVCLGNTQHLRSTHGTGFQLEFVLKDASYGDKVKEFVEKHFRQSVLLEEHGCMLNFEVPRGSIPKMSQAFRLLEQHRDALGCEDYSLSQSTLEQVFLKKIRPNEKDVLSDPSALMNHKVPLFRDYATGYLMWFLALGFPGLHHFYLGNYGLGLTYLLTGNEIVAGWVLDFFEMHVLVQKSVQEHGNLRRIFCCNCCLDNATCLCGINDRKKIPPVNIPHDDL